ncbi:MAG: hypothetical protein SOT72_03600 [Lactobacillus amylovorus]|nr:hypothetical protein [Lactobacillus amylovorus]
MQFNLHNPDPASNWYLLNHFLYKAQLYVDQHNLTLLTFFIGLGIIAISLTMFIITCCPSLDSDNASEKHQTTSSTTTNLTDRIKIYTKSLFYAALLLIGVAFLAISTSPYKYAKSNIIPGTAIIGTDFNSKSNTDDLKLLDDNIALHAFHTDINLLKASRTYNTLTLKPTSKTGKAYLRILAYVKKHKRDIYNPTINVQLNKTTLKYTDINGSHTVVCYANNQNQSANTNHETVLHY